MPRCMCGCKRAQPGVPKGYRQFGRTPRSSAHQFADSDIALLMVQGEVDPEASLPGRGAKPAVQAEAANSHAERESAAGRREGPGQVRLGSIAPRGQRRWLAAKLSSLAQHLVAAAPSDQLNDTTGVARRRPGGLPRRKKNGINALGQLELQ